MVHSGLRLATCEPLTVRECRYLFPIAAEDFPIANDTDSQKSAANQSQII